MLPDNRSMADKLKEDPALAAAFFASMTEKEAEALLYDWDFWARPNQKAPTERDWVYWLIKAGRGFGKTRTGGETVREAVCLGGYKRIALIGRTAADVRDTMIEGESGLLNCFPKNIRPNYEPSKRRVTFHNGAIATTYSGEEPDQLRGPQHDFGWCDELAAWKYADAWDQFLFGLRLGDDPKAVITTTPRPTKLIRELIDDPDTFVTNGSTFDNKGNLAAAFLRKIVAKFEGTRLGKQELYAEVLDDNPYALWQLNLISDARVKAVPTHVSLVRIVVGVDPAVTSSETADDTGIVVAGLGSDGHFYVLADMTVHGTPAQWGSQSVRAYKNYDADRVIGEVNNGGELVEALLRSIDSNISYKSVTASRGKKLRAEPIAALYEQGRVHHVGFYPELEDEMCDWSPQDKESPDRMDALVWALTELSGMQKDAGVW
jgi:phage terminase large subunit-like protein